MSQPAPLKREMWIDSYRGLLFMIVMMYHSRLEPTALRWLTDPFFLAGFFFLSGYLFSPKTINIKLKGIFNTLFLPLLIYSFLLGIFNSGYLGFIDSFKTQFFLGGDSVWFISCLIVTEVFFLLFNQIAKYKTVGSIFLIVLALVGYAFIANAPEKILNNHLPWNIDTAVWIMLYFVLGFLYKSHSRNFTKQVSSACLVLYILLAAFLGYYNLGGGKIDMHNNYVNNQIAYLVLSLAGVFSTFIAFRSFNIHSKFLSELGQYTLFCFPFHYYVQQILYLCYTKFHLLGFVQQNTWISAIINVILLACLMIIVCRGLKKYCPILLGKVKVL